MKKVEVMDLDKPYVILDRRGFYKMSQEEAQDLLNMMKETWPDLDYSRTDRPADEDSPIEMAAKLAEKKGNNYYILRPKGPVKYNIGFEANNMTEFAAALKALRDFKRPLETANYIFIDEEPTDDFYKECVRQTMDGE